MNTYGELPNYSLLHVYGFTLKDNPHDAVSTKEPIRKTFFLNVIGVCEQDSTPSCLFEWYGG